MTRSRLRRALRRLYLLLTILLTIALVAKIADHIALLAGTGVEKILKDIYEFLRDMSLLIATGGVAHITNLFQKRASFLDSLKHEWHDIVEAKSALLRFMHKPSPDHDAYMETYTRLSETIDNMRVVYRNVGETGSLVGLYPFAPLHDMRRVLQTLDPRDPAHTEIDRKLARDTMLRAFYALREHFLDELDLDEPDRPLLPSGARRLKTSGSTRAARSLQTAQTAAHRNHGDPQDPGDALLARLYEIEAAKTSNRSGGTPSTTNG